MKNLLSIFILGIFAFLMISVAFNSQSFDQENKQKVELSCDVGHSQDVVILADYNCQMDATLLSGESRDYRAVTQYPAYYPGHSVTNTDRQYSYVISSENDIGKINSNRSNYSPVDNFIRWL